MQIGSDRCAYLPRLVTLQREIWSSPCWQLGLVHSRGKLRRSRLHTQSHIEIPHVKPIPLTNRAGYVHLAQQVHAENPHDI
jgi:hypothetical protein